jgi:signal transduction histidine kinase
VPLRNNAGIIEGLVGIGRDVTERKNAEEQLQNAHAELQKSHDELKSAQFQLIQAEKMQSIGRLAAGVAHEVKNPLAILRMGVDYFSSNLKSEDKDATLIIDDMADAIRRADGIIMGLLDFSVPAALDIHPRDLNKIVNESIALVRHETASGNVEVTKNFAAGMPQVWLDDNKVKQVLVNIFTNAVHAMPDGGKLDVRSYDRVLEDNEIDTDLGSRVADRFHAGDRVVVLEIIDSGSGIPDEKLVKIFDPFFTTKPTGKGTGLGLTVTKKIIELHGGTIDLRNRKEGGVMVTIVFKV